MSIRSDDNWSGQFVNGIWLGGPARESYDSEGIGSGQYIWDDGRIPSGEVVGLTFHPDGEDAEPIDVVQVWGWTA